MGKNAEIQIANPSKPAATLKELRAQMIKPEVVQIKSQTAKIKELINGDGDDLDVDYLEDLQDDGQENERGTDRDEH